MVITKSWEIKWKSYWLRAKCKSVSLFQSWICVGLHLHCPGRAQCAGNRNWHVLEAPKCDVAVTY